jgi:hypothetical protein
MITVNYSGRFGNNLFQYFLGRIIAEEKKMSIMPYGGQYSHSVDIDHFFVTNTRTSSNSSIVIDDSYTSLDQILSYEDKNYILSGYFQKSRFLEPYREQIKKWFKLKQAPDFEPKPNSVAIHIRRSDFGWSQNSGMLSLSYYTNILDSSGFENVYVFGGCSHGNEQNDLDQEVFKALGPYHPTYIQTSGISDFYRLMQFENIIESNSTFCWWASFLSDKAKTIYSPLTVNGGYRDNDNLKLHDSRYKYVEGVNVQHW